MVYDDLNKEFEKYIENLAREFVAKAGVEISKAKDSKDLLELPPKKENWDAIENAEEDVEEHFKKAMALLSKVVVLTRGLEVYRYGLISHAYTSR